MSFNRRRGGSRAFTSPDVGSKTSSYPLAGARAAGGKRGGDSGDSDGDSDGDSGGDSDGRRRRRPMSLADASTHGGASGGAGSFTRKREKSQFIAARNNTMTTDGVTLHGVWLGAYLGDLGMVKDACSEDPDMIHERSRRADNKTPLMLAAQVGATDCVIWLLGRGAGPDIKDVFGRSALMLAAKYNFPDIVKKLLRHDRRLVNALSENNLDALMYAVEEGSLEAVQALMEYSPNMDTTATGGEHFGRTVMDIARAREGEHAKGPDVVRALHGQTVSSGGSVAKAARRAARRRISGTAQMILKEAMNFDGGTGGGGRRK